MGRKRLLEDDKRKLIHIRLPNKLIQEIELHGSKTEIIENAIIKYLKYLKMTK